MSNLTYWRSLQEDFLGFLEPKGYTTSSLVHYRGIIDKLIRYANAIRAEEYSPELGAEFVESEERLNYLSLHAQQQRDTVIRRLNEYVDGEKYSLSYLKSNYECPEPFKEVCDKYLATLQNSGLKYCTVKAYRVFFAKLCQDFVSHGIKDWGAVNTVALTDAFERSPNKMMFATYTKKLFKYLVGEKIVKYNYSGILPKIQYWKRIPSVYSKEEVNTILNRVNRDTEVGKRDYTILLLAARLGIRSGDIRLLRFENVNFDTKLIEFRQYKTGVPQRLTLLPEIQDALHDYIDNARGDSPEPYIFLNVRKVMRSGLSAGAISNITAKYFRESGINFGDRHHGSHALRMSLASALVAENVPYNAVRTILGHTDPDAITHYVKLDIENLRSCAIEVPAPSGLFANYLATGKGVYACE
jgi:integrase